MSAYEILSTGIKLKNLRKKYNLNQDDLSGNEITRNLISQIEHGKARLTKHAAEIMFKNLKKIAIKSNITIDENIDYLLEDEESQANKIIDKYIKELKDLLIYKDGMFQNKLAEVEEFMINWDIKDKKIVIFELAGDYYCNIDDLQTSLIYYEKAKALINLDMCNDNFASILRKLSMVYYYMDKYEENIKCCDFAINNFKNISEEYYCTFIYNSALCYIKLKEYDKALKRLNSIEKKVQRIGMDKYYSVMNQKVVCFGELERYAESLDINQRIIENIDKNNYQSYLVALINSIYIYTALNNNKKAKEVLNIIDEYTNNINQNSKYLPNIYFEIGKMHAKLEETKEAQRYYHISLNYAKKFNRNSLIKDILENLIDTYTVKKDKENISKIKDEFFVICGKEGKISSNVERKLVEFYLEIEDIQNIKELYNFHKRLS